MSTCFALKIFTKVPRRPKQPLGLTMSSPALERLAHVTVWVTLPHSGSFPAGPLAGS